MGEPSARTPHHRWTALACLPGLVLLAFQVGWPWPFFSDDAFISARYAQRLLAGEGLTWTDGERVEGYSNLLWLLATAGLGALGIDLVTAARGLGGLATVAALWFLARASAPRNLATAALGSLAPLLVAATQVVLAWTLGGLEGPLVLCWLAWGFANLLRAHAAEPNVNAWPKRMLAVASVPFVLLCWTRPDGPLWVAAAAAGLLLAARRCPPAAVLPALHPVWLVLQFAGLPFAAWLAQLTFRLGYYADFVPNTAHVKAEFAPASWPAGLGYVGDALHAHAGIAAAALVGAALLLRHRSRRALVVLLLLPALAWFAYLVAIGGDHFPCRRLLHGALAPMALLATAGLGALAATRPRLAAAVAVLLLGAIAHDVHTARTDAQSHEVRAEVWEWQGKAVGEALGAAFGDSGPLLAVDAAGALPYYSRLPALDLLGLCDRTIAATPLPAWLDTVVPGTPKPPGHLHGNGRYVLDRAPDLIVFGPPPGRPLPVFVSGAELEDDPRFLDGYRLVVLALPEQVLVTGQREAITANVWVRIDGKAGVVRGDDRITIPAWLFGSFALRSPIVRRYQPFAPDGREQLAHAVETARLVQWLGAPPCVAVPRADGKLGAELRTAGAALTLALPAGTWRVEASPAVPRLRLQVADTPAGDAGEIVIAADGVYELRIAGGIALPLHVDRVELRRAPR